MVSLNLFNIPLFQYFFKKIHQIYHYLSNLKSIIQICYYLSNLKVFCLVSINFLLPDVFTIFQGWKKMIEPGRSAGKKKH